MVTDLAEILALGEAQENGHIRRYERFLATKPQAKRATKMESFYTILTIAFRQGRYFLRFVNQCLLDRNDIVDLDGGFFGQKCHQLI
jgi:hypothetical protein